MSSDKSLAFARDVLDLIEENIYPADLEHIAKEYAGPDRNEQLKFLNRLYKLINNLHPSFWESSEQRDEALIQCSKYLESETIRELGKKSFNKLTSKSYQLNSFHMK